MRNALIEKLDQAISGTGLFHGAPEKTDPHRRVREAAETGLFAESDGPGRMTRLASRHGVTEAIWKMVADGMAPFPAAEKRLRELKREWRDTYNRMADGLKTSPLQDYQTHLDQVSAAIVAHQTPPETLSVEDCEGQRTAKMDSAKKTLHRISLEAHSILLPIFAAAKAAAKELLAAELKAEIERADRFGLPLSEVSEYLLSLRAVDDYLAARMAPPIRGVPIEDLALHLAKL